MGRASVEVVYLGYLTEAARRLGKWWGDDRVDSVEVVVGRIYASMRDLRRLFRPGPACAGLDHDRLVHEIGNSRYPIIGLWAGTRRRLLPLARLIVALRVGNPSAWILVSGPLTVL